MTGLAARKSGFDMEWLRSSIKVIGMFQIVTTAALIAAPFIDVSPNWWLLTFAAYFFYGCIGVTVGYHRYFTHRSFRAPRWAEILFSLAGTLGGSGSPASWMALHRQHHKYADTKKDGHSPHHLGFRVFLIQNYTSDSYLWQMKREFRRDRFQLWLHRYYVPLVVSFAGLLLALDWRVFMFGWAVPVAIKLWMSVITIYVSHMYGYRNADCKDESRNVWWLAYLTWGEGWHNNHHAWPGDWNFGGRRWWEVDMGAWVVRFFRLIEPQKIKSAQ